MLQPASIFQAPQNATLRHFDCGTCGPLGAGADGAGADGAFAGGLLPPSWFNRPLPLVLNGAVGSGGAGPWAGAPLEVGSEMDSRPWPASNERTRLVAKKPAASIAVARVSAFAVPRPVINPLVELTSPPPSDFCNSTTPIRPRTSMRWMAITTLCIGKTRLRLRPIRRRPHRTICPIWGDGPLSTRPAQVFLWLTGLRLERRGPGPARPFRGPR